jgi:RNA polymerase sigma factor (TIGR02999 family)
MSTDERPDEITEAGEVTRLLEAHRDGEVSAFDQLMQLVYADLKRIARGQIRRGGGTLAPTELVHEAWFKLRDPLRAAWESRGHFFAIAARAMRQIVVDRARERLAHKRGGGELPATFDEAQVGGVEADLEAEALLALEVALDQLASVDERLARTVECRFFGGLTTEETAEALGVNVRTVGRDWAKARMLLRQMLGPTADFFRTG